MNGRRRLGALTASILLALLCSGCMTSGVEGLYSLPQIADEYVQLESLIGQRIAEGWEYAAPVGGSNRQSLQLQDLDGDGMEEAVAFLADGSHTPVICIYQQDETGEYFLSASIDGEGSAISSVEYADITGSGVSELLVLWQISGDLHLLSVYSLAGEEPAELLSVDCSAFVAVDLDGDEVSEILDLRLDGEDGSALVRYVVGADGNVSSFSAPLSSGITTVLRARTGLLSDGVTALFVESSLEDGSLITDVFTISGGTLDNITLSSSQSNTVRPADAYAADIDGDRVLEIPEASGDVLNWYALDSAGRRSLVLTTYHNYEEGWYLVLPESFLSGLSVETDQSVSGERKTIFSLVGQDDRSETALIIYTLTGENRLDRANVSGRVMLSDRETVVYAADILTEALDAQDIIESFNLIYPEWQAGEL